MSPSPINYPGGKSRAIGILSSYIADNVKEIVSPFIGGASFEIAMANRGIRVFGYDAFDLLVNFWKHALSDAQALAKEVMGYHPLSRDDFTRLSNMLRHPSWKDNMSRSAAQFFAINKASFSALMLCESGMSVNNSFNRSSIAALSSFRCPNLSVDLADYRDVLKASEDKFMYLDPPYMIGRNLYGVDGELHKDFGHKTLARMLQDHHGQFLLSYNNCDEVLDLYSGFYVYHHKWKNGIAARSSSCRDNDELVICNYPLPKLPLFESL